MKYQLIAYLSLFKWPTGNRHNYKIAGFFYKCRINYLVGHIKDIRHETQLGSYNEGRVQVFSDRIATGWARKVTETDNR